jgi:hypothetical protein
MATFNEKQDEAEVYVENEVITEVIHAESEDVTVTAELSAENENLTAAAEVFAGNEVLTAATEAPEVKGSTAEELFVENGGAAAVEDESSAGVGADTSAENTEESMEVITEAAQESVEANTETEEVTEESAAVFAQGHTETGEIATEGASCAIKSGRGKGKILRRAPAANILERVLDTKDAADAARKKGGFYERIQKQFDALLGTNEKNAFLSEAVENSHFVNIPFEGEKCYVLGLVREEDAPLYIAYGVCGEKQVKPDSHFQWIPKTKNSENGYWVAFQSAKNGEIVS